MTLRQAEIDFEIHQRENNAESQAHLQENEFRFKKSCMKVLVRLCQGERLTVLSAINSGISSLPRRVLDLREMGIPVKAQFLAGDNFKTYFLLLSDIEWIKEKYKECLQVNNG